MYVYKSRPYVPRALDSALGALYCAGCVVNQFKRIYD